MISRRQFLVAGMRGVGAWLVGAGAARRIVRLAEERGEPYLVEVEDPVQTLWATCVGDDYVFTLGCAYSAMEEPQLTWRQWLERKEVDVSRPEAVRDFLDDWGWYRSDRGELYVPPNLEDRLPDRLQQNYLDWEYTMHDAPTALAYHYLLGFSLADREASGEGLGSLEFVQGPAPGNNASLVSASCVETLGGLQQRLLRLGERVRICVEWM